MRPLLFEGTWFELPVYFVIYMLAFLAAIVWASNRAPKHKLSPVMAIDLGMAAFVGGFLGARLMHIGIEYPDFYLQNPIEILKFWKGGFVMYGGLIGGMLSGLIFLHWRKQSFREWSDLTAPAMFLGIGIGRIACLSAGCCFGKKTDAWWGIIFTDPRAGAPLHISLHPTQIFESLFGFLAFLIFWWVWRRPHQFTGFALPWFLIAYGVFRFWIEFFRADPERGFWFGSLLSTSQIIAILTVSLGVLWVVALDRLYVWGRLKPREAI
jgi:phosphatidylglycerol:prolipoprotein diacylglycerol transferase